MTDHYFTAEPASADERRLIRVALAGREVDLETAPGVFSPGHLDLGTHVLLRHLPPPPDGRLLDVGCGWGPLALTAALLKPDVKVTAIDVNRRALDLLERNAARLGAAGAIEACEPADVPAKRRFDAIWSNPPIRIGKAQLHALLATWLPRLTDGGEAHLVVQKNLGADSLTTWIAAQRDDEGQRWGRIEKIGSAKGFRVLRLTRD